MVEGATSLGTAGLSSTAWVLIWTPAGLAVAAYAIYPASLKLLNLVLPAYEFPQDEPAEWPTISLVVPAYNEADVIRDKLENLLAVDYPEDRRQILVVSDASTDGTDEIVREYTDRGVELIRLSQRGGKTAAENEARKHVTGEIIVNTDATIRILPDAVRRLVRVFRDPSIGVASGRDVSVAPGKESSGVNPGEKTYVDYEMQVRGLETRLGGIVGASGCFFAIRRELFRTLVPEALSRDFASPMIAQAAGYRSVSVADACCLVPRTHSLRSEYSRKVRTMARGLETLWEYRNLLNPLRHPRFALMLFGHKVLRWLIPLSLPFALLGVLLLIPAGAAPGVEVLGGLAAAVLVAGLSFWWHERGDPPASVSTGTYALFSALAGVVAWAKALRGEKKPTWEPTRRQSGSG